jgi:agmatine deiminase
VATLAAMASLAGCGEVALLGEPPLQGHRLVGEFEPMRAVWLSYDAGHEDLTVGLVAALQPHVALKLLVADAAAGERALQRLQERLQARGLTLKGIELMLEPLAGFFLRDMAVFSAGPGVGDARELGVVDFRWTNYGVPAWCARRHALDAAEAARCAASTDLSREALDRAIARLAGARVQRSALAIEGGGVENNGQGLLIANEALYRQRNPGRERADMEADLLRLPGVRQVLWLPEGLAEDPHLRATITGSYVAWGTGGHTDEFVRFADPHTVLLAWPEDADVAAHPVSRLTRARMQNNLEILARSRAPDGRALRVVKVPMPRPIERRVFLSAGAETAWSQEWTAEFFPPAEGRRQGQAVVQLATASYLNFVLANGALVLPDYLPHGTPRAVQERVRRLFAEVFAGRQISFVNAISANWVGGGLHCATLTQP